MGITKEKFGDFKSQTVYEYTLTNQNNVSLSVITYGAIITKIMMPDKNGKVEEVTVNMTNLTEIVDSRPFHGAIIGPVAGRISNGWYPDSGEIIELDQNEYVNTLHSGNRGLDTKLWEAESMENDGEMSLKLTTRHGHGESGFPGNIDVTVIYTLTDNDEIKITYQATTDRRTIFNPTNHVYFNLSGKYENPIYDHKFTLQSDKYAVIDSENIPIGELKPVDGTDFDLRQGRYLKEVLESNDSQIASRKGLDHPFVLNHECEGPLALLEHEASGRSLEMYTDCDAAVIYTHNHVQKPLFAVDRTLPIHSGIAIETSALPDAVKQKHFGSIWLEPGEQFNSTTTFKLKY